MFGYVNVYVDVCVFDRNSDQTFVDIVSAICEQVFWHKNLGQGRLLEKSLEPFQHGGR